MQYSDIGRMSQFNSQNVVVTLKMTFADGQTATTSISVPQGEHAELGMALPANKTAIQESVIEVTSSTPTLLDTPLSRDARTTLAQDTPTAAIPVQDLVPAAAPSGKSQTHPFRPQQLTGEQPVCGGARGGSETQGPTQDSAASRFPRLCLATAPPGWMCRSSWRKSR